MGLCYLLSTSDGYQKIGRTTNLKRRLYALQTGSHQILAVRSIIASNRPDVLEAILHHRFSAYRRGGEWFQLPHADLRLWNPHGAVDFNDQSNILFISPWMALLLKPDGLQYRTTMN